LWYAHLPHPERLVSLATLMSDRPVKDLISQAELRKGAEFMVETSSAVRLIRQLYLDALERRMARGAVVEPGPLALSRVWELFPKRRRQVEKRRL
jgi:hypothetical protein